jgi:hypothetical protein
MWTLFDEYLANASFQLHEGVKYHALVNYYLQKGDVNEMKRRKDLPHLSFTAPTFVIVLLPSAKSIELLQIN